MSDISTLQTLVDWANAGIVFALLASLFFGGASVILSKRLNTAKDERAARDKQASDEKIAAANAVAEAARTETARVETEGKERVAKVETESREKTAALEAEAERAKTERAEANKQIEIAKADAARADEGAAKATAEVARLQVVVADAERKRAEAERALVKLQPRSLTAQQRAHLLELWKAGAKGSIQIQVPFNDGEAMRFAMILGDVLKEAGWTITGINSISRFENGLSMRVNNEKPPLRAGILQVALGSIGFPVEATGVIGMQEDRVILFVGSKP